MTLRFTPDQALVITQTAARISREFRYALPPEDLLQEWDLWMLEHPNRCNWMYTPKPTEERPDPVETWGWKGFRRDIAGVMAKACRRERELSFGLKEEDAYDYPKAQLKELLVWVYASSVYATGPERQERSAPTDAALGNNFNTSVADVRVAYDAVVLRDSEWDRVSFRVFGLGETHEDAAAALGLTRQTVTKTAGRVIDGILQKLNGTPSIKEDGPGSRKAVSNAQAQAVLHRED